MRNRVDPYGEILDIALRGAWMGNRGSIHRGHDIVKQAATKRWITCALEYKGWIAPQWKPGRWTALFFYDEALAFSAGHRPCALCRRADYKRYLEAVGISRCDPIDAQLDIERHDGRSKRKHAIAWTEVPAGTYVEVDNTPHIVLADSLRPWSYRGYGEECARPKSGNVLALTPPLTIRAIHNGYAPQMNA